RGPRSAPVLRDCADDLFRDEAALLSLPEVSISNDRVSIAPRRNVFLVEHIADACEHATTRCHSHCAPGLAAVSGAGDENVGALRVAGSHEPEAERRVVSVSGGVHGQGGVALS